ncbi:MAG: signal peptidase II [Sphingobacteriaceae bacterium]|nr:MAG: signal peptidase II [Sphingobacteriaceae bacterium]
MTKKTRVLLFVITALCCISCDRVTKDLAKTHLKFEEPKSYLNNFFRLEYAENTGAALSLGDDLPQPYSFILLSLLPIIFMIGLTIYVLYNIRTFNKLMLFSLSLIIAGGLGNIIDRVLYDRHVTDFMNMGIGNIRTGIFNVADICVTAGVIGIFFSYNSIKKTPEVAV